MKKVVSLGAAFVSALAAPAFAGEAPAFSSLPTGTLTSIPAKTPRAIGGGEKAPGFYVSADGGQGRATFVTPDAKSAKAMQRGGEQAPPSVCYTSAQNDAETEWSGGLDPNATLWKRSNDDPSGGVRAVHSERIVEKDGAVSLETSDAFVDPATHGARAIGKSTLPLQLVGKTFNDLRVYAARDQRKDGRELVTFVITRPLSGSAQASLVAGMPDGRSVGSSACGHLRMSLEAPTATGGSSVVVTASSVLPPLAPPPKNGDPDKEPLARQVRSRDVRIQLGVSKTARDKEPLLSVTFGWEGRETVQNDFRQPQD